MKKYTLVITEDEGLNIKRENKGFNITELIGFIHIIENDLLLQFASMMRNPDTVTRKFVTDLTKGTVEIHQEEPNK